MPTAQFEEKQYEVPANIELGLHHPAVFPAGQVLEAVVGYDVAAHQPQNAPIWRLIGVNAPKGLLLIPNLWQRARVQPKAPQLPSTYVSLILQYKRPEYLSKANALQWHKWGTPYFRFSVLQHQQDALTHLETALSARAVVRYSCAAFWKYSQLQGHQAARAVLQQSTFVSPSSLVGHQAWTYKSPGKIGWANPVGQEISTESFSEFWNKAKNRERKKENLFEHLRGLAAELGAPAGLENIAPDWLSEFEGQTELSAVQRQAVRDAVEVADHCGQAAASWFVADLEVSST